MTRPEIRKAPKDDLQRSQRSGSGFAPHVPKNFQSVEDGSRYVSVNACKFGPCKIILLSFAFLRKFVAPCL